MKKETELFKRGDAIRREVLGNKHVERSWANADEFGLPMQQLSTEYCWGEIWGREHFDKRTRSIINLAMLSALNRPHELKMHVGGALRNGLTKEDIQEIFLQVTIYCGVPAGVDAFRAAKEVFESFDPA